jgi:hypothetical protein
MVVSPLLVPAGSSPDCCAAGQSLMAPPRLNQQSCLGEFVEDLAVELLVAQRAVDGAVIPCSCVSIGQQRKSHESDTHSWQRARPRRYVHRARLWNAER